jgi:hypothetical protein
MTDATPTPEQRERAKEVCEAYTPPMYGPDIALRTCAPHYPDVRYWHRGPTWTDNGPGEKPNPADVQFCKLRGRITGIFQCYNPGELPCYRPAVPDSEKGSEP